MERPVDDRQRQTHEESRAREGYPLSNNPPSTPGLSGTPPLGASAGVPDYYVEERRDASSMSAPAEAYGGYQSGAVVPPDTTMEAQILETGERVIELREEQLVAQKNLRELGEVRIRTEVEEVPGRLEVEALREEVEVEHVPVGQVVRERVTPWEENGALIVPVYEEQLVMVKRLVLREQLRIRRVQTTETRLFEDTVRRERLVVEDPANTGMVHEQYPDETDETDARETRAEQQDKDDTDADANQDSGFLGNLVRKALM